jgi:hypothetical protein
MFQGNILPPAHSEQFPKDDELMWKKEMHHLYNTVTEVRPITTMESRKRAQSCPKPLGPNIYKTALFSRPHQWDM